MALRTTTTTLLVSGLVDNRARDRMVAALSAVSGVRDVQVSLFRSSASVVHLRSCGPGRLVGAIQAAGFDAVVRVRRLDRPPQTRLGSSGRGKPQRRGR